jgi:hypothetical protein
VEEGEYSCEVSGASEGTFEFTIRIGIVRKEEVAEWMWIGQPDQNSKINVVSSAALKKLKQKEKKKKQRQKKKSAQKSQKDGDAEQVTLSPKILRRRR